VTDPDATSDDLAETVDALIDRLDKILCSVEWQNLILGLDDVGAR
jgi:hypothetical protein